MASNTNIEWTDRTWNPTTGCDKVSPGCKNCYAEKMSKRLKGMGVKKYQNNFKLTLHPETLDDPCKWRKPSKVFVNSMSDLFHEDVPLGFILDVFATMIACPQHTFQILTKRSKRLLELSQYIFWPDNVWMGVSVEGRRQTNRIDDLRLVNAKVRFLSCEPLLHDLGILDLEEIHWVIVGGESGPNARPMYQDWAHDILSQCIVHKVAFFMKQLGGHPNKRHDLDSFPNALKVREFPISIN